MEQKELIFSIQGFDFLMAFQHFFTFSPLMIFNLIILSLIILCPFLYSAVDQFRKQFAHLEENGKNGPVVPLDRKHVSLPR
jgi:hypothetical protein